MDATWERAMADQESVAGGTPVELSIEAQPAKPVEVKHYAEDYSLKPLDIGTPPLARNYQLSAENYSVSAPETGTPDSRRGIINWGPHGRPRKLFPDEIKTAMIESTVALLRQLQPTGCLRIRDPRIEAHVRGLAKNASLNIGYGRLKREVVRPAFHRWCNSTTERKWFLNRLIWIGNSFRLVCALQYR
jgi:hypothetical protein